MMPDMPTPDKKTMWIGWTHAAMASYVAPEESDTHEKLVDDMIAIASDYADGMLDEFEDRFGPGGTETAGGRRRKPAKSRRARAEEEVEEEEEEEEEPD